MGQPGINVPVLRRGTVDVSPPSTLEGVECSGVGRCGNKLYLWRGCGGGSRVE